MNKHKISVIIPIYNCAEWIEKCVNSILNQKLPNSYELQVVLVDDGSSDNSGKICDTLAHENSVVIVIHQSNAGVSEARNKGIDVSDGDWICFVDGDDVLKDDAFMILSDQEVAEHDIVRFGAYVFSDTLPQSSFEKKYSNDKDEYIQLVVRRSAMLGVCGAFYKRELFFDNNIRFQQGIRTGEDWMVLFELLIKAKSFIYIEKDYYGYRVNESSVTRRLVSAVRPDALIALNHIIDYAKENKYVISLKDIAIARSDIRRNMMKEAILNKNKEFFINTDNALKKYAPQSFWADVWYSQKFKHKVGFVLYLCMDKLYRFLF